MVTLSDKIVEVSNKITIEEKARKIFDAKYGGDWQNFADGFEEGYLICREELSRMSYRKGIKETVNAIKKYNKDTNAFGIVVECELDKIFENLLKED